MSRWHLVAGIVVLSFGLAAAAQAQLNQIIAQGERRAAENAAAQQRVERLADQTLSLVSEYRTLVKVIDGLDIYNNLLQRQLDNQQAEIQNLQESIEKVSLIERQIVPLMVRMIDALDEFVQLDVPFLLKERTARIERLRTMMERSDVTAAEKFRQVLEAYQIENDYGRTIEPYKGTVERDGRQLEADFLRFGRVSLVYQSVGGNITGAWNQEQRTWETLPPELYQQQIAEGLTIARKEKAPDLVFLPVPAPQGGSQ